MASSKASYMFVSLLLLVLVLAHMDKALGEQIQLRNRKLKGIPNILGAKPKLPGCNDDACMKKVKKGIDFLNAIPRPPPPPPKCNDECMRTWKKAYDLYKARRSPPPP